MDLLASTVGYYFGEWFLRLFAFGFEFWFGFPFTLPLHCLFGWVWVSVVLEFADLREFRSFPIVFWWFLRFVLGFVFGRLRLRPSFHAFGSLGGFVGW